MTALEGGLSRTEETYYRFADQPFYRCRQVAIELAAIFTKCGAPTSAGEAYWLLLDLAKVGKGRITAELLGRHMVDHGVGGPPTPVLEWLVEQGTLEVAA